jgi:hypothetical protein
MEKIILGRGKGKTERLINISHETKAYIVCKSLEECARVHRTASEMNKSIPFPISYDEFFRKKYYAKGIQGFLIDNVEMLLEQLTDVPIIAITLTQSTTHE